MFDKDPFIEKTERWERRLTALHALAGKSLFVLATVLAEIIMLIGLLIGLYHLKLANSEAPGAVAAPNGCVVPALPDGHAVN